MAIESVGIIEQVDGVNMACMEASEDDINKTEIRTIQQLDIVHAKKISVMHHVFDRVILANDDLLLTNPLSGTIASHIIEVGDNSVLEVGGVLRTTSTEGFASVIPIILDASDNVIGVLPPKHFCGVTPDDYGNALHYVDTDTWNLMTTSSWWVGQYDKIALYMRDYNANEFRIWAKCRTGHTDEQYNMFTDNKGNTIGSGGSSWTTWAFSSTKNN